jgi:hypothetical protein
LIVLTRSIAPESAMVYDKIVPIFCVAKSLSYNMHFLGGFFGFQPG